jgi:dCTP deaminase
VILKADRIAQLLKKGEDLGTRDPLVITPTPRLEELETSGSAAVDLRLGTWFTSLRPARSAAITIDDGQTAMQATKTTYVPFGQDFFLHPRAFVLAVTLEWVRIPGNLAAYVVGKSSWGRCGLIIATATGVHPGFKGCLTLELSNVGEIPIGIKPGISICQLFLHEVSSTDEHVDSSSFVGTRKPMLRRVQLDEFARKLAKH